MKPDPDVDVWFRCERIHVKLTLQACKSRHKSAKARPNDVLLNKYRDCPEKHLQGKPVRSKILTSPVQISAHAGSLVTCKRAACGKRFDPKKRGRKEYCSDACAIEDAAQVQRAPEKKPAPKPAAKVQAVAIAKKRCAHCKNEFQPIHRRQEYCGQPCRDEAYELRHSKKPPPSQPQPRNCRGCGREFTPKHGGTQYCSRTCRARPAEGPPVKDETTTKAGCAFCRNELGEGAVGRFCSVACERLAGPRGIDPDSKPREQNPLGELLFDRRRQRGMLLADLSDATKLPVERLTGIQTGSAQPSYAELEAIAGALELDVTKLFDAAPASGVMPDPPENMPDSPETMPDGSEDTVTVEVSPRELLERALTLPAPPVVPATEPVIEGPAKDVARPPKRRANYLPARHYYRLNLACAGIEGAFDLGIYLVGSCLERQDYRDVDVRAIVTAEWWRRVFGDFDAEYGARGTADALWSLMCCGGSAHLSQMSGLPVDFQIQEQSTANAKFPSKQFRRSALGIFVAYAGGPPEAAEAKER